MCCPPQSGTSEERYYIAEYSMNERAAGLHLPALAFAHESRSERDNTTCCAQAAACLREGSLRGGSNHSRVVLIPPASLQMVLGATSGLFGRPADTAATPAPVPTVTASVAKASTEPAVVEDNTPGPDSLYTFGPSNCQGSTASQAR